MILNSRVSQPNSKFNFSLAEDKIEGIMIHRRAATEGRWSKDQAKPLKGGSSTFDVHGLQTPGGH